MFLTSGIMKSTMPIDKLSITVTWAKDLAIWLVRFIGVSELLAAAGLLLPSVLRIKPALTPVAASCLIGVMIMAIIFHISRREANIIGMHISFLFIASFIAGAGLKKFPFNRRDRFLIKFRA
jgi:putative oxidoreductase